MVALPCTLDITVTVTPNSDVQKDRINTSICRAVRCLTWPCMHAGHSLGGALATLAAFDIRTAFGFKDLQVYTYGAPRTGNHAFARCAAQTSPLLRVLSFANPICSDAAGTHMHVHTIS